ncbi:MAG: HD-GYP domain-containing protein [Bacillota bacterium]
MSNTYREKFNIEISNLQAGMKLADDIEHDYGGILLPAGTILDESKIERLKHLNYNYVYVYDEDEKEIKNNLEKTKNSEFKYRKNMDKMQAVFYRVRHSDEIRYEDIQEMTDEVKSLGNEQEMINLLTKVRDTDEYTYSHLLNVGILAYMFGNWLDLDKEKITNLTKAGLIHDLGKTKIPDKILNKPDNLTEEEYEKMKNHSIYGYEMAKKANKISDETARGVLTHHERYNGKGYPLGMKGEKIPLFGRILAIVDTFDAITANRIYHPACSPFDAIKLFREETFGEFDYNLLKIFLDKMPNYFVNEKVILNDGREAEIVFINPRQQDTPIIKVGDNYIDLYMNENLKIERLANDKYEKKDV